MRQPFEIANQIIEPGKRQTVDIPISVLSNHVPIALPVEVVHGREPGPTLFLCAAIHGDEVLGVEIIRQILKHRIIRRMRGTLLSVPIVNAFGFINQSRYLPDRRDLNRSFPGGSAGSLAAQLAHVFMTEIVARSNYGIDLHTAAIHRSNLPQIRADLDSRADVENLARAFGAPVVLDSTPLEGSLRAEAGKLGVPTLVYEAGEALRYDRWGIRTGFRGVLRIMQAIGMIGSNRPARKDEHMVISQASQWERAPGGGILRSFKTLGNGVQAGDVLGIVSDPFGRSGAEVIAQSTGVIIGEITIPVVNQGDALFHIAKVFDSSLAETQIDRHEEHLETDPLFQNIDVIEKRTVDIS